MPKLIFYASIIIHNGKPALMIRKIFTQREDIEEIVGRILKEGKYEFRGVLIFRNTLLAIRALKEVGLIKPKEDSLLF